MLPIFRPLKDPAVATVWSGLAASTIGEDLFRVAVVWIAAEQIGNAAGYVNAAQYGAMLVVGLLGASAFDRWRADRAMIGAKLGSAVLALLPVEQSNGTIVHSQFGDLAARVGVPRAVLSDHGSDLNKGVRLFQQDHPEVVSLYDIVHLTSRKIEKVLARDSQWGEFRKSCCECANAVRQSPVAHLKPPRPKTKAR